MYDILKNVCINRIEYKAKVYITTRYMEVLYSVVGKDKKKERFETILEPLQAITQLAILAYCPKGSKLSISNNLLYVQQPTWTQGFVRSYNHDARDDLYFLFNVIRRFNKFYTVGKSGHSQFTDEAIGKDLYDRLISLSKIGINNLIQTYSDSDKNALLHTLQMYRTMLDNPDVFESDINRSDDHQTKDSIDDIFVKITDIYKPYHIHIIYNTIKMMEDDNENYNTYMEGLNTLLKPTHSQINKWISDNIVF